MPGIDTDPDRHALDAEPDPDPEKLCGSDPIRIYNTAVKNDYNFAFFSTFITTAFSLVGVICI